MSTFVQHVLLDRIYIFYWSKLILEFPTCFSFGMKSFYIYQVIQPNGIEKKTGQKKNLFKLMEKTCCKHSVQEFQIDSIYDSLMVINWQIFHHRGN